MEFLFTNKDLPKFVTKEWTEAYDQSGKNYSSKKEIRIKTSMLIQIDLSKQIKLKDPQQISFIGKLLATRGAKIFFIIEKLEETALNFHKILSQSYK